MELFHQVYTKFNFAETPEFKIILNSLDEKWRFLMDMNRKRMGIAFELCSKARGNICENSHIYGLLWWFD